MSDRATRLQDSIADLRATVQVLRVREIVSSQLLFCFHMVLSLTNSLARLKVATTLA